MDGNQEFLAIGFANLVGCFFSCYPLAASLSRSAVNVASGARTALSGIVSTLLVVVSLLFLAPVVYCIFCVEEERGEDEVERKGSMNSE